MISVTDEMVQAFKLAYVSGPVKSLSPENERIRRSLQAAIDAHLSRDAVVSDEPAPVVVPGWAWRNIESFIEAARMLRAAASEHMDAIDEGSDAGEESPSEIFDNCIRLIEKSVSAARHAAVPDGWMLFPVDAWKFLWGTSSLEGVHFGDKHPARFGTYWWRNAINDMLAQRDGGG